MTPAAFRAALADVPAADRDAWCDRFLGIDGIPADDAALPRGCVPYLPAPIEKLVEVAAHVRADDVFVDVGAGIGRAVRFVALLTGAAAIGIEIQPSLVAAARALGADVTLADAAAQLPRGDVYFLYCPFSGDRLAAALDAIARARPRLVCCLDLPLPACGWLELSAEPSPGLAIYTAR